jgi:hypothetical protein
MDIVFVAGPEEAVKILGSVGPRFTFPVLASGAIASKTVIAVAPIAVVAASVPTPEIQESRNAIVHMEDTSPANPIMSGQPVRSMFQIDSSAFRVILDVDWGLLNSGGAAFVQNVNW